MDAENSVRGIARNYRMCINCVDNSKKLRNVHLNAATNIPALLTNMLERKARSEDFKPYMNDRESKQRQENPQQLVLITSSAWETSRLNARVCQRDDFRWSLAEASNNVAAMPLFKKTSFHKRLMDKHGEATLS
jgi:hypothetical protein